MLPSISFPAENTLHSNSNLFVKSSSFSLSFVYFEPKALQKENLINRVGGAWALALRRKGREEKKQKDCYGITTDYGP
ncbi:hypothetical protein NDI37_25445 [Funiculus sociatus GB2-A5]|uniref:Uncharacterized protein n=1 Tax=Funiculus sociatus GB2-A5 TaxID=2933946 RepID=A0ABV0JWF2_9CYAN|nr:MULTISPECIES: hypothetical protein [unclassified Trichocoleus]MBD1905584.1 hypothetical protein [Trichocoleus sp. FACHB-832]MBD2061358.1 hypothetical protein [Trichocoleus sp. FACHB-6]